MKVLVNIKKKGTEKIDVMNVSEVRYCEGMLLDRDMWAKGETRADGLLIIDYRNREWCIPNVDKETADAIVIELYEKDKCDLRQYGICC